jgi:hypothetical protein
MDYILRQKVSLTIKFEILTISVSVSSFEEIINMFTHKKYFSFII